MKASVEPVLPFVSMGYQKHYLDGNSCTLILDLPLALIAFSWVVICVLNTWAREEYRETFSAKGVGILRAFLERRPRPFT